MSDSTLDTADIANLLGVSRAHVTDRIMKRPDAPKPVINLSRRTRRWDEAEIRRFAAGLQRAGRRRAS